jgi:transposase InsO family protein
VRHETFPDFRPQGAERNSPFRTDEFGWTGDLAHPKPPQEAILPGSGRQDLAQLNHDDANRKETVEQDYQGDPHAPPLKPCRKVEGDYPPDGLADERNSANLHCNEAVQQIVAYIRKRSHQILCQHIAVINRENAYLAVILDLHSRRVVGWAVSDRIKKDLAIRALDMAVRLRQPPEGCLFHSDRGSQYCSYDYQKKLQAYGLRPSMSGKGNCHDNASVETFFKSLKAELIWRQSWPTRRQAEAAIFQYINGF